MHKMRLSMINGIVLLAGILIVSIIPAQAADVGLVVSFPDRDFAECVNVASQADGYELLSKSSLDLLWAKHMLFGHQLCMIDGVGDEISFDTCGYSGSYWGFFIYDAGSQDWQYMPVGFDGQSCWNRDLASFDGSYCAKDGDVIGLNYGEFGDFPRKISFEDICRPLRVDVRAYVDGKRQSISNGKIKAWPNATIEIKAEIRSEFGKITDIEGVLSVDEIIDKSLRFSDLKEGEKDSDQVRFALPVITKDEYDLILEIEGMYGDVLQFTEYEFIIDVRREDHDVSVLLETAEEMCAGSEDLLYFELLNLGRSDEQKTLVIGDDNMHLYDQKIALAKGEKYEGRTGLKIDVPGAYTFTARYGEFEQSIDLLVIDCDPIQTETSLRSVQREKETQSDNPQIMIYAKSHPPRDFFMLIGIEIAIISVIVIVIFITRHS